MILSSELDKILEEIKKHKIVSENTIAPSNNTWLTSILPKNIFSLNNFYEEIICLVF